ncbi:hypothetical protein [Halobacillus sp. A5]|uniref:hypothetical protein n=1 Tax=Halobacillus sp. A5 TaxID=2880263 RepID=UPI0020A69C2A|nr:hypothetical protein [Halobacillus sp. A5]MCP3027967.1 hypothetical protein [Halobacillus sp. A5]
MGKENMYHNLKREFIQKMGRDLKKEEKEFIKWMVEEHYSQEDKERLRNHTYHNE